MDITCAESKATYEQIKKFVLERYGFKESTLYIVQVKRKYDLDFREHYNMSKNENQKVFQYPTEKEEAILDALKHFKML
jgi:RNA methyltransferase, trmA family